jgi:hypothetical protein
MIGKRLQFCLKFECAGYEYWDSNANKNYVFQCFGPSVLSSSAFGKSPERKKSPPVAVAPAPLPAAFQRHSLHNYSVFSQSPAMHDDPWHRYL